MDRGSLDEARAFLEEAVSLQREIGDQYYLANFLNNLGNVARAQGDYPYASQLYRESLERNRELGDGWQIAYVLEDIGGLAAKAGQPERALLLIGAAETLRQRMHASLAPHERARLDQFLELARNDLEPIHAASAWQAGKAMSMDQAIDMALSS
jgi:non-specific serine/threonine protein kinase